MHLMPTNQGPDPKQTTPARQTTMRALLSRLRFILIWTCVFYLGSLALLFVAFIADGTYWRLTGKLLGILSGPLWEFSLIIGPTVGFLLGIFGKLPGTGARQTK